MIPESPNEDEDDRGVNEFASNGNMLEEVVHEHARCVALKVPPRNTATKRNHETFNNEEESLVGTDVILYAVVRPNNPVALATILSTNPNYTVGDVALGKEFYEVLVNTVLRRDAILPRPYDGMQKMADADNMCIAWPSNKIKPSSKRQSSSKTTGRP